MAVEQRILRAARELMNNPAYQAILDQLTADALNEFSTSAPDDKDTRERAYWKHTALIQIEEQIGAWSREL